MKNADAVHILTDKKFVQKVTQVHAAEPFKGLFVMGEASGFVSASTFLDLQETEFKEVPVRDPEHTLMAMAYTSGTTGLPKAAEITHFNFVASFYVSKAVFAPTETDIVLAWHPITHPSGLASLFLALSGSVTVIAPHALDMDGYAVMIDKYKVTSFGCYPARLRNLAQHVQSTGIRLDTLRRIVVGGSVVTREVAELTLRAFGKLQSLMCAYGMTEAGGLICVSPGDVSPCTDVGYPAARVEIKILDLSSGEALGPNESGELYYRSPKATSGYYKRPLETAQFRDSEGWCRSGDLAYYDSDGRIHFVERLKELIQCLDNQVAPAELEQLLLDNHDGIAEVAVVGLPDPVYGEAPAAFVVPIKDLGVVGPAMETEIKEIIAGTCAKHKHLYGGVFFVEALPKTENGKVQRKALVATWATSKCA